MQCLDFPLSVGPIRVAVGTPKVSCSPRKFRDIPSSRCRNHPPSKMFSEEVLTSVIPPAIAPLPAVSAHLLHEAFINRREPSKSNLLRHAFPLVTHSMLIPPGPVEVVHCCNCICLRITSSPYGGSWSLTIDRCTIFASSVSYPLAGSRLSSCAVS